MNAINSSEIARIIAHSQRLRSEEAGRMIAGWFRAVGSWLSRESETGRPPPSTVPGQNLSGW